MPRMQPETDTEEYNVWCQELKDFQQSDLDQRDQARESDLFLLDKDGQWEDNVRRRLDAAGRPRYTFDKITPVIESMMADIETLEIGCVVKPEGGQANKDTAQTYEGMIRGIQNMSNSAALFRKSCRRVIRRGFDAWVIKARYKNPCSFEQDLFIEEIPNSINRVWVSNTCEKETSEDADKAFILSSMSKDAYKREYPKGSGISVDDDYSYSNWQDYQPEVITIGECYYRKEESVEVGLLTNGDVVELNDKWEKIQDEYRERGITVARTKKIKSFRWYHRVFDGGGFLTDEAKTVFKSCPVITVYGNHELLGESSKVTYSGITLKEMDAQRVHNYAKSREIEEGALSPRPKWWMTKKQSKGHETQLARMNVSNDPVQFYNADPEASPPYFGGVPPINPNLANLGNQMALDIKEQANVNPSMEGNFAASDSEDAIRMKIDRGTASTRKWVNAVVLGVQRVCEILIETIPEVYDTKRQFSLVGADGTEDIVILNDEVYDKQTQTMVRVNVLNEGTYKVAASAGEAFANKLEAGLNAMLEYAAIDPSTVDLGGDLMLKSINAPLVDQMAERKRMILLQQGLIPESQLTDEEREMMAIAAQQPQQPSPDMVLAMAEQGKAEADLMNAQNKQGELMLKARDQEIKVAELGQKGIKVDIERAKAVADIRNTDANTIKTMTEAEKNSAQTTKEQLDTLARFSPVVQ